MREGFLLILFAAFGELAARLLLAVVNALPAPVPAGESLSGEPFLNVVFRSQLPLIHIICLASGAFGAALIVLGVVSVLFLDGKMSGLAPSLEEKVTRPLDDACLLPLEAQDIVKHILETLVEIRATRNSSTLATEADFLQGQMDTQYIPSVISAYLAIPRSRQATYQARMIEQLRTLSTHTDSLLDNIASERAIDLEITQRFFAEKFGRPADAFRFLTESTPPKATTESSPAFVP